MRKNEAWVKIGSSVVASLLCFLVLNVVTTQLSLLWKVIIICTVALVALAVAFWGGKKEIRLEHPSTGTSIGTGIKAKGGVKVQNVRVNSTSDKGLKIGSNIEAGKDVEIKDIHVKPKG